MVGVRVRNDPGDDGERGFEALRIVRTGAVRHFEGDGAGAHIVLERGVAQGVAVAGDDVLGVRALHPDFVRLGDPGCAAVPDPDVFVQVQGDFLAGHHFHDVGPGQGGVLFALPGTQMTAVALWPSMSVTVYGTSWSVRREAHHHVAVAADAGVRVAVGKADLEFGGHAVGVGIVLQDRDVDGGSCPASRRG